MRSRFAEFHGLHHAEAPLFLPNAWDHASAAALAAAGFRAIGTTSLGVASAAGKPDGTGETREETIALARRLAGLPCLLTVDIEGGFGGTPAEVAELAADLAEWEVAGVNLEDGRADGSLADVSRQCETIAAIKERVPGLFLNARTDTFWLGTGTMGDTLARAHAYADGGADGVFVPGVADDGLIRTLAEEIPLPLNVLFVPNLHSLKRLAELGVRRVSCGSLLFRAALGTVVRTARAIADDHPVDVGIPSYAEVQALAQGSAAEPHRSPERP